LKGRPEKNPRKDAGKKGVSNEPSCEKRPSKGQEGAAPSDLRGKGTLERKLGKGTTWCLEHGGTGKKLIIVRLGKKKDPSRTKERDRGRQFLSDFPLDRD